MNHHLTPLRYPGGKRRLAPFFLEILVRNECVGGHYVEPYAGGSGVAIELLLNRNVSRIHLNDSSVPVYAFWRAVTLYGEQLCRLISSASLTVDEWKKRREIVRQPNNHTELEVGFSVLYLNRCNRSGVLSGGLIGGLAQSGEWKMDARFSRIDLIRRIEAIASRSQDITVTNIDAEVFITSTIPDLPDNTLVYCDPPYFKKSRKLYLDHYKTEDHERISGTIQKMLSKKWVVSYDAAPEIIEYYKCRRMFTYNLQYSAATVYKGEEVFIFSDNLIIPQTSSLRFIKAQLENLAAASGF